MNQFFYVFKSYWLKIFIALCIGIAYYFCLPSPLFNDSTATVLYSANNKLLGAQIAKDGQWRFPHNALTPKKFETCILLFEDEYFYKHPGFNPVSITKAIITNIKAKKIKRGGSTLTQQVIRLARKGKARTYIEKIKELIWATRLEFKYSKSEILNFYTSNAPFGGNVVGLSAAAWRYYNINPENLSWAQTATLAVLPNAPSLIYPGKNQKKLLLKRNKLLKKLLNHSKIDSLTYQLAIAEKIPQKPFPLPQMSPHLLQKIARTHQGQYVKTTLKKPLQANVNQIVKKHYNLLSQNEIFNAAVLVLNVQTRQVLAYVGNTPTTNNHQKDVDIINKARSTGSILKPFLYAAMLDSGDLLPETLIADTPIQFGSYSPKNFNNNYDGAVPASNALARSLNVPAVNMLKQFGLDRFHFYLKKLKLQNITQKANYYGLSLILGGAESNLWDLCKSYASLSSTVNHFSETSSEYYTNEFCEPIFMANDTINFGKKSTSKTLFNAAAIYHTFESLKTVNRPEGSENWEFFDHSNQIAWKTGTSFGFRDAWAIGTTKNYVVGVWVGNADGEGRPGLVGVETAAPIMFDVFNILPKSPWFDPPFDEMKKITICKQSGHRATTICKDTYEKNLPKSGLKTPPCPYHKLVHLDKTKTYQVNTSCENYSDIITLPWFVLPPLMAHYYTNKNPFYKPLPNFKNNCKTATTPIMDFIYPKENTTIYLPKNFNHTRNELILKVAHSKPNTTLFWYINNKFIKSTTSIHEIGFIPEYGDHTIVVTDELGNEIRKQITLLEN